MFFWRFNAPMALKGASPSLHKECSGGVPPGRLRETSVVSLLSNLGLPDQGLGLWTSVGRRSAVLGQPGAFALGRCHLGVRQP